MIKQKHIPIFFLWLLCGGFLCSVANAQETNVSVNAGVNRAQVLLGEPISLKIELSTPLSLPATQLFNLPDTFNHLEVIERKAVDSSVEGAMRKYVQQFTVTGFDSGTWNIPSFPVLINNKTYSTQPIPITIVPVQLRDSAYHDIHEIISVPKAETPWWYWAAGAVLLIASGVVLWWWFKKRKKQPAGNVVNLTDRRSALQEAIDRLRQLQQQELPAKGDWKTYYSTLTEIVKVYAQKRLALPALQYTTDELLVQFNTGLSRETLGELAESLRIADAVKFARYVPGTDRSTKDIKDIEAALHELDRLKQ
ncbi:MAG: BatD family protein [Agriterribacter sp.]